MLGICKFVKKKLKITCLAQTFRRSRRRRCCCCYSVEIFEPNFHPLPVVVVAPVATTDFRPLRPVVAAVVV